MIIYGFIGKCMIYKKYLKKDSVQFRDKCENYMLADFLQFSANNDSGRNVEE